MVLAITQDNIISSVATQDGINLQLGDFPIKEELGKPYLPRRHRIGQSPKSVHSLGWALVAGEGQDGSLPSG